MGWSAAMLVVAVVGANQAHEAQNAQAIATTGMANEQKKAQSEQKAIGMQKQAEERRKLVREERVRRAQIIQSSENSGTSSSSGETGAISSMGTQLGSNLGSNVGMAAAGERIGGYMQNAADFQLSAQNAAMDAQSGQSLFNIGTSMFNSAGGFKKS